MERFLRNFDALSFWIGFLVGGLFWFLLGRMLPALRQLLRGGWEQVQAARESMKAGVEFHYRNDLIRYAQRLHLAAPLFSLDEIYVPARLIGPRAAFELGDLEDAALDIVTRTLPYMPDWPELAAAFDAPTISLAEALSEGANLAIIGHPGSGKTVALARLASRMAQSDPDLGEIGELLPVYVHATDFSEADLKSDDPLATLVDVVKDYVSSRTAAKLSQLFHTGFDNRRVLLIFDGLDELDPDSLQQAVQFLEALLAKFPATRVVTAVSPYHFDGVLSLGLMPVAMAAWNGVQKERFLKNWGEKWVANIHPAIWEGMELETVAIAPEMLNNWVATQPAVATPLELTLWAWAAYAGDMLGPTNKDAIYAHVRRICSQVDSAETALERIALQMVLKQNPVPSQRSASRWSRKIELEDAEESIIPDAEGEAETLETPAGTVGRQTLPALLEAGVLIPRRGARLSFLHPIFTGYFAGRGLSHTGGSSWVMDQPDWAGKVQSIHYLAAEGEITGLTSRLSAYTDDVIQKELLMAGRWLRDAPKQQTAKWRMVVMRELVNLLQTRRAADSLRTRALSALLLSGDPGVTTLMRKLIRSNDDGLRYLSALGLGYLKDQKAVNDLVEVVYDSNPAVQRAACLALAAIGGQVAIDAVATALIHGDENLQRAAAEALANNREEGYELLREASVIDDLMARRAAVFGLMRIPAQWARTTLDEMQTQDEQWIVRNAASQVLDSLAQGSPFVPRPLPALHDAPWLIAFAGQRGEGVPAGEGAKNLLYSALKEGDDEQRLAALQYLRLETDEAAIPLLYALLMQEEGEVRETAFDVLWHAEAAGQKLPSPIQYGFGTSNI